jgi:hypothetical protein
METSSFGSGFVLDDPTTLKTTAGFADTPFVASVGES